jgi:ParB/RepB/Spo0J family partition protein
MKANKIAESAEEMKQKLFGQPMEDHTQSPEQDKRFSIYLEHIGKTVTIPIAQITIEENVRKEVDVTSPKFRELVESIRRDGLLQNLVVDVREGAGGVYLSCVSGQRRLLAAREAGVEKAVCLLKRYSGAERVSTGLTENLVRQDLCCIDIAEGYAELRKEGWSEAEIATRFERDQRTIHRYLVIATWPAEIRSIMRKHPDVFTTRVVFNHFVSREFKSPNDLLNAVQERLATAKGEELPKATEEPGRERIRAMASSLAKRTGYDVSLRGSEEKGTLSIKYPESAGSGSHYSGTSTTGERAFTERLMGQ